MWQNGVNSWSRNADVHERTIGCNGTNDTVENKFAIADFVMRCGREIDARLKLHPAVVWPKCSEFGRSSRGISCFNTSGIVVQRNAHDFDWPLNIKSDRRKRKATPEGQAEAEAQQPGFFWQLSRELRRSLVRMALRNVKGAAAEARADREAHDAEKLARREEAVQHQLKLAVNRYAEALELFSAWKTQGVKDNDELKAALRGKSEPEKVAELRRQIEMRTLGLGWTQFETRWGFFADERQHKIKDLTKMLLDDILPHEMALRTKKKLPKVAAPPQTKAHALKQLGTVDADVRRLEAQSVFDVSKLLVKAEAARLQRRRGQSSTCSSWVSGWRSAGRTSSRTGRRSRSGPRARSSALRTG